MGCVSGAARLLALAAVVLASAQASAITFFDDTFANADWSRETLVLSGPFSNVSDLAHQETSGGNPDAYRRVTHSHDTGTLAAGHFRSGATYSPSADGAIETVDYAFDAIHLNPAPGESVALAILLLQGGSFYATEPVEVFDAVWTSFSDAGLVATDFTRVSGGGSATPDFSASGGSIQLGMLTSTTSSSGPQVRELGFDNWRVTLDRGSAPPKAPALAAGARALAAALLLAAGLAGARAPSAARR